MTNLIKTGRLFFGLGIIAYGIQQIVIRDFRPQILPGFPAWAHDSSCVANSDWSNHVSHRAYHFRDI
ncbi:MAG: hypothetical protein WKG06_32700 [Segetibacter sp.]